jgi:pSer/pThr/pTyr-binding forkhead associated (FHA) protein
MSKAILYQISEDGSQAERWELSEEPVVVGRSGQAKVSIEDDGLSRRHFLIVREGGNYVIRDLNSRNGTWVDGNRIFAERLHHNDRIMAGRTRFLFANPLALGSPRGSEATGPHGTQLVRMERDLDCDYSTSNPWQDAPGAEKLEAVA